jgi:perosamine synthetase
MTAVTKIAQKHGLWVVEDAAEAHGAEVEGKRVGSISNCATFSFFGNKIITTGEGGMITTDDAELAAKLRLFRGQGMDPNRRYWFPVVGYNYRMTNIQAAIGLAQLEQIEDALKGRERLAAWYQDALQGLQSQIILPKQKEWAKQVFWMYNILIREGNETRRDRVMQWMDKDGIETRPVFYPMHVLPPYKSNEKFKVADIWSQRGINLPTHLDMTTQDVKRVAQSLKAALDAR